MNNPKPDAPYPRTEDDTGATASNPPQPESARPPPASGTPAPSTAGISAGEYLRAPASDRIDITPTAVAREDAMRRSLLGDHAAEDGFSDVRLARQRRARWRRALAWSALPLAVLLAATAWWSRAELAGRVPALRPLFEAACAPLGCRVPPWRNLAALRIGASQLERPGQGDDAYRLSLNLLNDSRAAVALPELELTLTDGDDRAVAVHRFAPADYLAAAQRGAREAGLAPGGELALQVRFRTQAGSLAPRADSAAEGPASYRLRILYR